jgi:hypothetical protein
MNRRNFINNVAGSALGVSTIGLLPSKAKAAQAAKQADHIIYLYMEGGMSHLDTFDPKTSGETKGQFDPIPTVVDGQHLSQHLKGLASHADKMAVVRSMFVATGAHRQAQYVSRTSFRQVGSIVHPGMGAWMSKLKPTKTTLPGNVLVSGPANHPGAGWMPKKYAPVPILDPNKGLQHSDVKDVDQFKNRWEILNKLNSNINKNSVNPDVRAYVEFYDETINLLQSSELDRFNISKEDPKIREKYGNNRFGQGCLLARRLVEHGVSFVEVRSGGWDNHVDIFNRLSTSLPQHDTAITTLIEDLEQRGLLEKTLIVLTTEFGRTPKINVNTGRDHFPAAFSSALIGAGVKGGTDK